MPKGPNYGCDNGTVVILSSVSRPRSSVLVANESDRHSLEATPGLNHRKAAVTANLTIALVLGCAVAWKRLRQKSAV